MATRDKLDLAHMARFSAMSKTEEAITDTCINVGPSQIGDSGEEARLALRAMKSSAEDKNTSSIVSIRFRELPGVFNHLLRGPYLFEMQGLLDRSDIPALPRHFHNAPPMDCFGGSVSISFS